MRIHRLALLAALALGAGAPLVLGCEIPLYFDQIHCSPWERVRKGCDILCIEGCLWDGLDGGLSDDAGEDASDVGSLEDACDGECMSGATVPFFGPVLLWTGPSLDPATAHLMCPEKAPQAQVWYANLMAPPAVCGACSCDPPVGSCTLPSTMTARSTTCGGPQSGVKLSPFDAPDGWNGSCTSMNGLDEGEECNGVPCVKSITIDPLVVTEGSCTPVTAAPPKAPSPPTWGTTTVVCQGTPFTGTGGCKNSELTCVPAATPGFSQCIYRPGVFGCPAKYAPYLESHIIYEEKIDERTCTPCTCSAEQDSSCLAKVSVFSDDACSTLVGTYSIDETEPACFDILPVGSALRSKSASLPIYQPGTCQPNGGDPAGSAFPDSSSAYTLCCMPSP